MRRQAKWVRGEHFERRASLSVEAPVEKVFPLLCPVREYEWIPDWSCRMLYSQSGVAEKGAVFTTGENPIGRLLWTCTVFEPPKRVEYLLTRGSGFSTILELELATTPSGCEVSWTMKFTVGTALSAYFLRKKMSEERFQAMIRLREKQLRRFFTRGQ